MRMPHLQLHLLVILLAGTAVLGHLISLDAPALVVWRSFFAALGGAALLVWGMRRRLMPPRAMRLPLLAIGAVMGAHWMCFFGSIKLSNISICLAGLATISFFTALTEPLVERRRVRPLELLLGLLVLAGILLVAGFERGHLGGLGLALLAALLAAVFPVFNRRFVRNAGLDPLQIVVWEMAGCCLFCLACMPIWGGLPTYAGLLAFSGLDWLWLLLLAWLCTVFAHSLHVRLLRHFSAFTMNLAFNLEPVYGIAVAAWWFGEHRQLHAGFFAGTAFILIANIAHPVILRRLARRHQNCV